MQGFNKYYPPDYDPNDGSLNKLAGKHALGDRARKLDQGILIVRFELPFNIWCGGCDTHLGMGVRYNAEKRKVGMYYSTPIFAFRCKCHLCSAWFEVQTDPKNTRYVVTEGARQKNEDWDAEANGNHVFEEKVDEEPDPFALLEKTSIQKTRALSAAGQLDALQELSDARSADPYALSKSLRKTFREEKKLRVVSEGKAEEIRVKYALGDRVTVQDMRTPAREVLEEESAEWGEALRSRGQTQLAQDKARERLRADRPVIGAAGASRTGSSSSRSATTRKDRSSKTPYDRPASTRLSSSRPSTPHISSSRLSTLGSSSTKASVPKSSAAARLASLTSSILLNSASKADPFGVDRARGGKSELAGVRLGNHRAGL